MGLHFSAFHSRLGNVMSGFTYVYIIRMNLSASNIIVTVVVPRVCVCVCVCVSVRSFLPPRASRPRNMCSPRHGELFSMYYNRDFC